MGRHKAIHTQSTVVLFASFLSSCVMNELYLSSSRCVKVPCAWLQHKAGAHAYWRMIVQGRRQRGALVQLVLHGAMRQRIALFTGGTLGPTFEVPATSSPPTVHMARVCASRHRGRPRARSGTAKCAPAHRHVHCEGARDAKSGNPPARTHAHTHSAHRACEDEQQPCSRIGQWRSAAWQPGPGRTRRRARLRHRGRGGGASMQVWACSDTCWSHRRRLLCT